MHHVSSLYQNVKIVPSKTTTISEMHGPLGPLGPVVSTNGSTEWEVFQGSG